jgi:hypothetical protein
MYLTEILGYIDKESVEKLKGRVWSCSDITHLIKVGIIGKNVQISALMKQVAKCEKKLADMSQTDAFPRKTPYYR